LSREREEESTFSREREEEGNTLSRER